MKNDLKIIGEERIKDVLVKDKGEYLKLRGILKSEITALLKNYLEINLDNVDINFVLDENGYYNLEFLIQVERVKTLNAILLD